MSFGIENFKQSEFGRKVGEILMHPQNISDMTAFSRHGHPAVQVVGKQIDALGKQVTDGDKKQIGRWVREIMEHAGWTTSRKGRVAPGNLFSTGAIYDPK